MEVSCVDISNILKLPVKFKTFKVSVVHVLSMSLPV